MDSTDDIGDQEAAPLSEASARARRLDGARQPISEAVEFRRGDRCVGGWALNMSRGGLRAALEEAVDVNDEYEIVIGEEEPRTGKVIWVRNQKDGAIVGVSFLDTEGSVPPPPAPESMPGD